MRSLKTNLSILFLCCGLVAWAQFEIPEKPAEQTSVYDYISLLSTAEKSSLEQKLIGYADSTSTQIVLAIISSTEGENINFLGANWAQEWGIGQADTDNGIFILLARDDRRIGINTGYGVEEFLTDALSKRIIENIIIPEFRNGDYYGGLDKGADAIFAVLRGEFKEERTSNDGPSGFPLAVMLPFIIFVILMIIIASRNRGGRGGRGNRRKGLDLWDIIILSNMGRGGYRGSSGGGGSFGGGGFSGGFGGGGFGGGGASGGW